MNPFDEKKPEIVKPIPNIAVIKTPISKMACVPKSN